MKKYFMLSLVFGAVIFTACNSNNSNDQNDVTTDSSVTQTEGDNSAPSASGNETNAGASINGVVSNYLKIKNALANDNSKEAASAATEVLNAMNTLGQASLTSEQKKVYDEVQEDAKEHADHIIYTAGKIDHQREHFETLSKDVYDLVKTFGAGQTLYQDFCPMYNNNKGATWISETKEIKNPYLGKKMPTCGEVKEEIK